MRGVIIGEDSNIACAIKAALPIDWLEWPDWIPRQALSVDRGPEVDAADPEVMNALLELRPDLILNASGLVGGKRCEHLPWMTLRANYYTAQHVAQAASCLPHATVVHLGTTASYNDQERPVSEHTPPSYYQTLYSATKLMGEEEIFKLHPRQRLVLRPALIYGGLKDRSSVVATLLRRHFAGDVSPLTINLDPMKRKALTYLDDFVEAAVHLIRQEERGVFVIGTRQAVPYNDVLAILWDLGVKDEGITWDPYEDSLGHHVADPSRFLLLYENRWPVYSLREGLTKMYREYEVSHGE